MTVSDALERGRAAFARRQWRDAYEHLGRADDAAALAPEDLQQLATAAYLTGNVAEAIGLWRRGHHELIDRGQWDAAARWGAWLSLMLLLENEFAQSTGWLARTQRLLANNCADCAASGYVCILQGLRSMGTPDAAAAQFEQAITLGERFDERDLMTLGLLGSGQSSIAGRDIQRGIALFDEAMIAVTAGEVSPTVTGIVYCAVILECQKVFDVRRAREWTTALAQWCASQAGLVPFRGRCLVHRAEILQMQGEWDAALAQAIEACEWFAARPEKFGGRAHYQRAEIHRLRGELELAEKAYLEAGHQGHDPQPGLSLLRLAQGDIEAARAAIERIAGQPNGSDDPSDRTLLLGPCVEIMLAAGDLAGASKAADELAASAVAYDAPFLHAMAKQASGAVALAREQATDALSALREAWMLWQQLEIPYESARTRIDIGRTCQRLGDSDTARVHLEAAQTIFERLGAATDLERFRSAAPSPRAPAKSFLTGRELEVLALMAVGKTNRQIGDELCISQHTVARHVSNIFDKLGVASRTAATALAYQQGLVQNHGRS